MSKRRTIQLLFLVLLFGFAQEALAAPPSPSMASGRVINRTSDCGEPQAIRVQVMGVDMSPRLELEPSAELPLTLSTGLYAVMVFDLDGRILEQSKALVLGSAFNLYVGCESKPAQPKVTKGTQPEGERVPEIKLRLVNSFQDCGTPYTVTVYIDGEEKAVLKPKSKKTVKVPKKEMQIEAFVDGKRLLTGTYQNLVDGASVYFGCTFNDHIKNFSSGIPVSFQNTTDACSDPNQKRFLTFWVDGIPIEGIAPGKRGGVRVLPGEHVFQVFVGLTTERVVRGVKDVQSPFRVHFGCGR